MSDTFSHLSPSTSITLSGDKARARDYIGEANRMLFQHRKLVASMGATCHRLTREFEDSGVKMATLIVNGREFVEIFHPIHGEGKKEEDNHLFLYLEGRNTNDMDEGREPGIVHFIFDINLNPVKVRKKINKHLFIENIATVDDQQTSIIEDDLIVNTITNMAPYLGGPWMSVGIGVKTTLSSGSQSANINGGALWTGTSSGSSTETVSNDYPAGGDVQYVHQDTITVSSSTTSKYPIEIYATPFLPPVSFAYDYASEETYESTITYTRTWDTEFDPPRWWNPTNTDIIGNQTSWNYSHTVFMAIGGVAWASIAGPGEGIDPFGIVGQNRAAAVRTSPESYHVEEDGEMVTYAVPAQGDIHLIALAIGGDTIRLIRIYKRDVVSRDFPLTYFDVKGENYTVIEVRGGEAPLRICEFGVCTIPGPTQHINPRW